MLSAVLLPYSLENWACGTIEMPVRANSSRSAGIGKSTKAEWRIRLLSGVVEMLSCFHCRQQDSDTHDH